jgi:Uma2 family endonuclease
MSPVAALCLKEDNAAMATQPIADNLVSLEEYLSTCYEPDCEYDDGLIVERNVGEYDHSFLQTILGSMFTVNIDIWGVYGLTEQRIRIAPRKYRIPDVCVLRLDAPVDDILNLPPLIAIEILSPEDRWARVLIKASEYRDFGVENVWVIDPRRRKVFAATAGELREIEDGIFEVKGTPIRVQAGELFAKLDRMRARSRGV